MSTEGIKASLNRRRDRIIREALKQIAGYQEVLRIVCFDPFRDTPPPAVRTKRRTRKR